MKIICQNQTAEWSFTSSKSYKDPFNELEISARFTHTDGTEKIVPAFWGGAKNWRVRFSSPLIGKWHFKTVCSNPSDSGLHGQEADFQIKRYAGSNSLFRHGPIQVASDKRHFEHTDGKPFFWLGDTWWMGLCNRMTWPKGFQTLTKDRVKKGFTVVQIVAGLYPDMPAFDKRGANEAGFPWDKDYKRINPDYFDMADRRIQYLVESGLAPCIVACWGYFLPWMGMEKMKKHWRNLVARYGSYPVLWCLAGEGIMPYYLSNSKEDDRKLQKDGWKEMAVYLKQIDPYRRPITMHPGTSGRKELGEDPKHSLEKNTHILTSITGGWLFKTDPDNCGETQSWYQTETDKSWKAIKISSPWTEQGNDYHGAAWYTVECAVPQDIKNPVHLFFHAVDGTAKVWIDGNLAGEQSKSADIMWNRPWGLDVSRQLVSKKKIRITIKVVKDRFSCGIYSPVELLEQNEKQSSAISSQSSIKKNACAELVEEFTGDVLDFDMLQTGHGFPSALPNTIKIVSESYERKPAMPVVQGEVLYDGIGGTGNYSQAQRWLYWACILNGVAGYTYGANGIWQVNTLKKPYGPSPHGMSWGDTPWEEAYQLSGSTQLAIAKRFLEKYEWWKFEPHPEWVQPGWTKELNDLPFTCGRHDIPTAAGIPGKLRIIYLPMGVGLQKVKGIEKNASYRAKFFNPVNGTERNIGEVKPDAEGNWKPNCPDLPSWNPMPVFQDWIMVLETKGGK